MIPGTEFPNAKTVIPRNESGISINTPITFNTSTRSSEIHHIQNTDIEKEITQRV